MKGIKDELQNIILGDEQIGFSSQLKKAQSFLRGHAKAGIPFEEQQHFKEKETTALITFAKENSFLYGHPILSKDFISEGAEQKVYWFMIHRF